LLQAIPHPSGFQLMMNAHGQHQAKEFEQSPFLAISLSGFQRRLIIHDGISIRFVGGKESCAIYYPTPFESSSSSSLLIGGCGCLEVQYFIGQGLRIRLSLVYLWQISILYQQVSDQAF
jgi:hypothetical protein